MLVTVQCYVHVPQPELLTAHRNMSFPRNLLINVRKLLTKLMFSITISKFYRFVLKLKWCFHFSKFVLGIKGGHKLFNHIKYLHKMRYKLFAASVQNHQQKALAFKKPFPSNPAFLQTRDNDRV